MKRELIDFLKSLKNSKISTTSSHLANAFLCSVVSSLGASFDCSLSCSSFVYDPNRNSVIDDAMQWQDGTENRDDYWIDAR